MQSSYSSGMSSASRHAGQTRSSTAVAAATVAPCGTGSGCGAIRTVEDDGGCAAMEPSRTSAPQRRHHGGGGSPFSQEVGSPHCVHRSIDSTLDRGEDGTI
jgi:hypothetical protein